MRKEGGKDAVLHMKHRDVLMEGELKPFRRGGAKEFEDLADVQVVARRESAKAFGNKEVGGEWVGDVEGEVTHHGKVDGVKMVKCTEIADEDSIRLGVFDEAEEAGFSRFLDPGRGQKDRNLGFFTDGLDRGGEAAEILKVEIEEVGRLSEEGLGLGRIAAKDGKFDDSCRGPFGNDGGEQLGQLRGRSRGRSLLWRD